MNALVEVRAGSASPLQVSHTTDHDVDGKYVLRLRLWAFFLGGGWSLFDPFGVSSWE